MNILNGFEFDIVEVPLLDEDTIRINIFEKETNKLIAHLTFTKENFASTFESYGTEPQEIIDILEEYEPVMSLDYIETNLAYVGNGFAEFLIKYFCDKYVKDNPCMLITAPYGHKSADKNILIKFYSKFGFKPISGNSDYMVKNIL